MMLESLYSEPPKAGNKYRTKMLREVQALVRNEQRKADSRRKAFFTPDLASIDNYERSAAGYRKKLIEMLGWPLTLRAGGAVPSATIIPVGEDALGRISRIWIETLPGVKTYGLFFQPRAKGRFPLVVSQHGGGGTPELCSGFFGSANYNDMTRRVLRRGAAVFAPQLLLWHPDVYGPAHDHIVVDRRLKHLGGSLAALELYRIFRGLDYFASRRDIDPDRIGMIGLSYGGFYSLFSAAIDTRIKVAVSSCFFNDRTTFDFADWSFPGAANRFLDAEVGALVCPRPLYIEVGRKDEIFDYRRARPEAKKTAAIYQKLGVEKRFRYKEHNGGHELDPGPDGINFLFRHLKAK